ncbi:hypothetical protein TrVFT333_000980 [Trichoderma virens FT-333]|nr:hypothetical protein TrVFT333_000980 [Trichoderma virens FT-333]
MGSLRNIMNVDDDHVDSHSIRRDRRPTSRTSIDQDLSVPMPRYNIPVDLSRQTSPPHILHPAAPPLGYNSHPGGRRRSNTSTDSMDSSYGQSQNHTSYYTGTAMRPIMSGASSGDHPVKLTPITGRVSRAKKGVPVHTCDVCRPPKTFTRAEHLRRHQLSHQPPELSCTVSGCKKVFYRKDLLDRHLQRHGEHEGKLNRDSSRRRRSGSSPTRPYSSSPPAPTRQTTSPYGVGAATTPAPSVAIVSGHWSSVNKSTPQGNAMQSPHMRETQSAYQMADMSVVDPVTAVQIPNSRVVPTYDESRSTGLGVLNPQVPELCMPETTPPNIPWTDSSGIPSTASGSAYSTPASGSSKFQQSSARAHTAEWSGQMPSYTTSPSPVITDNGYPMTFTYAATPPQLYSSVYGDSLGAPFPGYEHGANLYSPQQMLDTTVRSMSPPQLIVGQSAETMIAAPSALPVDRMMYPRTCSREPVDALGLYTLMPTALSHGIRSMIPTYIEVYWDKVHSMYPIIHKPTFENPTNMPEEHLEILQCSMAAIATQFLEHEEHRANGHQLHTYAMDKAKIPRAATLGLDYSDPATLPIPLSMGTLMQWDAQNYQEWSSIAQPAMPATVGATILETISAADIASIPAFDASLFLVAHVLQLPQRQSLTKINLLDDASSISMNHFRIMNLFPYSPIAMSHLALHYTPLHTLLSVSGDSWVFNKKVLQATDFMEHQRQLEKWRDSGSAAVAAAFAARALKLFLGLQRCVNKDGSASIPPQFQRTQQKEISDFWGIYVCSLICWAFGHVGNGNSRTEAKAPTRRAAIQWILKVSDMEPGRIQQMSEQEKQVGSGAVNLARASLEKDCLGGRNILLADAVGVLKKLEEGDNYRRF